MTFDILHSPALFDPGFKAISAGESGSITRDISDSSSLPVNKIVVVWKDL